MKCLDAQNMQKILFNGLVRAVVYGVGREDVRQVSKKG